MISLIHPIPVHDSTVTNESILALYTCLSQYNVVPVSTSSFDIQPLVHLVTTMATLWYCCGCKFGPHNSALYDACIQCSKQRCPSCVDEKVSQRMVSHDCHTVSPYPGVASLDTPRVAPLETRPTPIVSGLAELPRPRSPFHASISNLSPEALGTMQFYGETYMYICCQCRDGPKIWNNQPKCVMCGHIACDECEHIK